MDYKYKTKKSGNEITIEVTIPKLNKGQKKYKIDSQKILFDLREKYDILTCVVPLTLKSSYEQDVSGEMVFATKAKKTRRSRKTKEDSESKKTKVDKSVGEDS